MENYTKELKTFSNFSQMLKLLCLRVKKQIQNIISTIVRVMLKDISLWKKIRKE